MRVREDWLPKAIAIIESEKISDKNKRVPNEYKGYIDSFATAVVQNGLVPAVILFDHGRAQENGGDKEQATIDDNHKKLMTAILELLKEKIGTAEAGSLFEYITKRTGATVNAPGSPILLKQVRREITDAVITLKLALRTYKFTGKDEASQEA